jgi:urease alpha subunit
VLKVPAQAVGLFEHLPARGAGEQVETVAGVDHRAGADVPEAYDPSEATDCEQAPVGQKMLLVDDEEDVQVSIHTDTLNEAGF